MSEDLTRKTLKGATLIISAQGLSRLVTFIGNVLLVRAMKNDAKPLGISSTQLHLLYVAALALTRDGVRRACLRELPANVTLEDEKGWGVAASLSRAYTALGLFVITPIVFSHFWSNPPPDMDVVDYQASLILTMLGSVLELSSEPLFLVVQTCGCYRLRSTVEAVASFSRVGFGLFTCLVFGFKLKAFACGYFAAGLAIFLTLFFGLARESQQGVALPLKILFGAPSFVTPGDDVGKFTFLTTIQSGWKLGLGEGEKIVMIAMGTVASDRGAYAMAANLGSLAARLLLQPSEEAAFTLFGKLKRNGSSQRLLSVLTRATLIFGLIFICFGTQYTHLLVLLLYGRGWADATETPYLLCWYCVYIASCAVNGITEAYLQAVATDNETHSFNGWLLICSIAFIAMSTILMPQMGTSALIAANSLVMGMRIARNVRFAQKSFHNESIIRAFLPSPFILLTFGISLAVTAVSNRMFYDSAHSWLRAIGHVGIGVILLLLCMLVVYVTDKELVDVLRGRDKLE